MNTKPASRRFVVTLWMLSALSLFSSPPASPESATSNPPLWYSCTDTRFLTTAGNTEALAQLFNVEEGFSARRVNNDFPEEGGPMEWCYLSRYANPDLNGNPFRDVEIYAAIYVGDSKELIDGFSSLPDNGISIESISLAGKEMKGAMIENAYSILVSDHVLLSASYTTTASPDPDRLKGLLQIIGDLVLTDQSVPNQLTD